MIVLPIRLAIMAFDLVVYADVWPTFVMTMQTDHLDAVAMINAYFVDEPNQGLTLQYLLVSNSTVVSNNLDKRFEDVTKSLRKVMNERKKEKSKQNVSH